MLEKYKKNYLCSEKTFNKIKYTIWDIIIPGLLPSVYPPVYPSTCLASHQISPHFITHVQLYLLNICFDSSIFGQSGVRQQIIHNQVKIDHKEWSPCSVPNAEPKSEGKTLASDVEKQGCRNQGSWYKVSYNSFLQAISNPEPTYLTLKRVGV